ncbi:aminotransferase class V-fold PLP-dependent enzyme [Alteromonas stellipolaris]|jgi:selenocysteine lyase/cysteine desulfurase|uniref:aminotransferase class V-fold PLP-dependent enzyme n=1 Tax=Alteromonas stellipolaris TaxID=233316 RepID=UPI0007703F50|nr:aminotransferase class V-fold PLP-dependent enzyme [Alteromonas stellipolaris]AMJ95386.1 penicillin epimerase [Alteromonas stellipolaris]MDO6537536.1 aminotransferase class V-fold PLP-dependent enzyme [Alteromonas stellipolaris]MDP2594556.1 aminotransferase class V-fold PLP-dependent enzyme [Alteromonas stellipolaris]
MSEVPEYLNRRQVLKALVGGAVGGTVGTLAATKLVHASSEVTSSIPAKLPRLPERPKNISPEMLAKDESFWAQVALNYDKARGIVNLEHGYWGKMSKQVQQVFIEKTEMVNTQLSVYGRKHFSNDLKNSAHKIAQALGADSDEVVITRNATESIHNLMRQYNDFNANDTVLFADIDYPSFKETMRWLAKTQHVKPVEVTLPAQTNQAEILNLYITAFDENPNVKLMLLTHVSNQHGLILPVADIAKAAKARGIDVICDCAQSWGLLDFNIAELNVDWAGFNLHKWIGSPVGVGALYMKKGTLDKISPYPGETDPTNTLAHKRVHTATSNFASILTVPAAIDFHQSLGAANKEARLRYLRNLWVEEAKKLPNIEVLGGEDDASSTGMGAFRTKGKVSLDDAKMIQQRLENEFNVFTVVRVGLASGCCIRVTPQIFISAEEIKQLILALKSL